ncbi:MAG: DUF4259 domain-containing protein [Deltaproteobacteria bacterium]|nr:DUF4259 domain-containing protein [Deltaproteobacteria bacterium]
MGAWGIGNFENDAALDWLATLTDMKGLTDALRKVADAPAEPYLDADSCCAALAAAEVIAALCGVPGSKLPERMIEFVASYEGDCTASHLGLAMKAIARIDADSELQELFDEGGRDERWHGVLRELSERLSRAAGGQG